MRRDEILFLGNRGLIIKSSSDSITARFQRWYSFTTDFHSRFPPLRNIFLGGRGGRGDLRLVFILNLPHQGGNGGTSLPCNFLFSFFPSPSPLFAHLSQPSLRHSPLFTTSKRRRCFFSASLRRKNFWGESLRDFFYS